MNGPLFNLRAWLGKRIGNRLVQLLRRKIDYRFANCAALLKPGGQMILHTMMPGFNYHSYPVDCMRFYPDWFKEVAKRQSLVVADKYIHNTRITYLYRKAV